MLNNKIDVLSKRVIDTCTAHKLRVVTAESCTGGMIGGALTDVAGSSAVFDGGFMTYSNYAKYDILGVPKDILKAHGAVSMQTAEAMAAGALQAAGKRAQIAIAVTGVAGPGGGSPDKPVGTVYFATARKVNSGEYIIQGEHRCFPKGSRHFVRLRTVETALQMVLNAV